jgi:hypothetical protein
MKIEISKIENPTILEGEINLLSEIRNAINDRQEITEIEKLIDKNKSERKSGIYADLEFDVKGFYELDQTKTQSIVLKQKFRKLSRETIRELLINRLDSVIPGSIELPEAIFETKTLRIEFEGRLIDVNKIRSKKWEYTIYQSVNNEEDYYVEILFGGVGVYTRLFKLSQMESTIIKDNISEKIDNLINLIRAKKG